MSRRTLNIVLIAAAALLFSAIASAEPGIPALNVQTNPGGGQT